MKITATTFQLKHLNSSFKSSYSIGDIVDSPCGIGTIIELDVSTGNCKLEMDKNYEDVQRRSP